MTATHEPYLNVKGSQSMPYAVTLRGGRTNSIIEIHRFPDRQTAWAFYEAHR